MSKNRTLLLLLALVILGLSLSFEWLHAEVRVVVVHERNLFVVDEFGTNYRQLTDSAQFPKWYPRFSPDGKLIAFMANMGERIEVWIINYEGTAIWPLTSNSTPGAAYGDGGPAWSADGAWIYFGSGDVAGDCEVWRARLDGTAIEQLTNIEGYNTQSFDISAVDSLSVFVRGVQGGGYTNQMYIDNLSFTNPVLIQSSGAPRLPRISPDGQQIAYTYLGSAYDTHIINIDGTADRLVISNAYPVCWHPDGTKLLICQSEALYWVDLAGQNKEFLAYGWWASACNKPLFNANAGENLSLTSDERPEAIIIGSVSIDEQPRNPLSYRWKVGELVASDWAPVNEDLQCPLVLSNVYLAIGTHTLSLEITDGTDTSTDTMILTIENSAPHVAAEGSGTYESPATVTVGGFASDYDGDLLICRWLEDGVVLHTGSVQTIMEGQPVRLPDFTLQFNGVGDHILRLEASDGVNSPATADLSIKIIDTTAPTLSPTASTAILWPPNHQLLEVVIRTNASDNLGGVRLEALVTSNEPEEGTGDGDMAPDWSQPVIDEENGTISLMLRAERSALGTGRIYSIIVTATDSSNNSTSATIEIIVPHDKKR